MEKAGMAWVFNGRQPTARDITAFETESLKPRFP